MKVFYSKSNLITIPLTFFILYMYIHLMFLYIFALLFKEGDLNHEN